MTISWAFCGMPMRWLSRSAPTCDGGLPKKLYCAVSAPDSRVLMMPKATSRSSAQSADRAPGVKGAVARDGLRRDPAFHASTSRVGPTRAERRARSQKRGDLWSVTTARASPGGGRGNRCGRRAGRRPGRVGRGAGRPLAGRRAAGRQTRVRRRARLRRPRGRTAAQAVDDLEQPLLAQQLDLMPGLGDTVCIEHEVVLEGEHGVGIVVRALEGAERRAVAHVEGSACEGAQADRSRVARARVAQVAGRVVEHGQKRGHVRLVGVEAHEQLVGLAQDERRRGVNGGERPHGAAHRGARAASRQTLRVPTANAAAR